MVQIEAKGEAVLKELELEGSLEIDSKLSAERPPGEVYQKDRHGGVSGSYVKSNDMDTSRVTDLYQADEEHFEQMDDPIASNLDPDHCHGPHNDVSDNEEGSDSDVCVDDCDGGSDGGDNGDGDMRSQVPLQSLAKRRKNLSSDFIPSGDDSNDGSDSASGDSAGEDGSDTECISVGVGSVGDSDGEEDKFSVQSFESDNDSSFEHQTKASKIPSARNQGLDQDVSWSSL